MHINYISTKFYIPIAPDRYVIRQRLVDKLKYEEGVRLSLITAPAGFGKTTAVIHSVKEVSFGQDPPSSKIAWLSLDEHDNGFLEFVSYFIGAIRQVENDFASDLQTSLLSGQEPTILNVAKELINQLARLDTFLYFVLDDFQVITDPKIPDLMNLIIEYLPPHIHLIISSRKPVDFDLSRWRGRGWLNELETKHLRFTLPETEAFLYDSMQLVEDAEIVTILQDHTGGWVVGLQLAAVSIRDGENYQDSLARFGGGTKHISDYLLAEIFAKQTSQIQGFLLKTSIADKFTVNLCAKIVNSDVALARIRLEELEKNDLFVIALDDKKHWFQYHKIFLEFLKKQRQIKLDAETASDLHRNAAQWFGYQNLIVKAVEHSLLAQDYDAAVKWMAGIKFEQVWEQPIGGKFSTWIPQFPTAKLKNYPHFVVVASAAFLVHGEMQLFQEMLQILQHCQETENEYKLFKGVLLRPSDQEGALEMFHQVLNSTKKENEYHHLALSQTAVVLMEMGELKQATHLLAEFSKERTNIGSPQIVISLQRVAILSNLYYLQGQLHEAESVLAQGFEHLSAEHHQTPMIGLLHNSMGQIHLVRNELDAAEKHYREALRWGEFSGVTDILHFAFLGISDIMLTRYDEGAMVQLDDGYQPFRKESGKVGILQPMLDAKKAFVQLHLDNYADAISWADKSGLTAEDRPLYQNHSLYQIYIAIKCHQFYEAQDKDELLKLLPMIELLQMQAQSTNHIHHYLNCLIAKSIVYDQCDRQQLSLAALYEALGLLERTELFRLFLLWKRPLQSLLLNAITARKHSETIRRILLALANQPGSENSKQTNAVQNKVSLTNREMEILTLIALGLTNKKIAKQLVISENTLRTHVRNLYRKLEVHNRTQAMKAGQNLGLL